MANMSYCRFELTYTDLKDCEKALSDAGDVSNAMEDTNDMDAKHILRLVKLCKQIADRYYEEVEEIESEKSKN